VDVYGFIEVTARVTPGPSNPFVGASLNGELHFRNQHPLSATGSTIRFVDAQLEGYKRMVVSSHPLNTGRSSLR
jgi:hypothetical protein